jgi:hypothetical protein
VLAIADRGVRETDDLEVGLQVAVEMHENEEARTQEAGFLKHTFF